MLTSGWVMVKERPTGIEPPEGSTKHMKIPKKTRNLSKRPDPKFLMNMYRAFQHNVS